MSERATKTQFVPDHVTRDDAIAAQMARYEAARCRSVEELLAAYGGTRGAPATTDGSESTSVLPGTGANGALGVGIWLKLKNQLRLIAGECRRFWESATL
jgi:hypothetical protein